MDCAGKGSEYAVQIPCSFDQYVTFSSPLLRNIDAFGLGIGSIKNVMHLIENNVKSVTSKKGIVKWGYFVPAPQGIQYLKKLVDRKQV